jgi:hypothetical protein
MVRQYQHNSLTTINPIVIAQRYATTNSPTGKFPPTGANLQYQVREHGEIWLVELTPQGYAGGGVNMVIRRNDGKVMNAEWTQ